MIDHEARRRLLDTQNQADAANARADAAAASRDLARESAHRLQQEVSIAVAIASETLAILAKLDPWSASRFSESVLSHYEKYQNNRDFPDIADLLTRVAKVS
jgi:hypothetical protein